MYVKQGKVKPAGVYLRTEIELGVLEGKCNM